MSWACKICGSLDDPNSRTRYRIGVCDECAVEIYNSLRLSGFVSNEEMAQKEEQLSATGSERRKAVIPEALRWEVFNRDGHSCKRCGSGKWLRADHIHPESKGGPTTLENLQTLCRSCNSRKGVKVA